MCEGLGTEVRGDTQSGDLRGDPLGKALAGMEGVRGEGEGRVSKRQGSGG